MADGEQQLMEGQNREKEEIELPETWTQADLKEVKLYGMYMSPPCVKVRTVLDFYKVPYTNIDGSKPDSKYKKIPVLDIGNVQINDSFVMVNALAPVLQGVPYTPEEKKLEEVTTFGLMLAMEAEVVAETCGGGLRGCGWHIATRMGCKGCCICCAFFSLGCCITCCKSNSFKSGFSSKCLKMTGEELRTALEYSEYYAGILGDSPFFHGAEIGLIDVSLFGVVVFFVEAENEAGTDFLSNPKIRQWFQVAGQKIQYKPFGGAADVLVDSESYQNPTT